MIDQSREKKLLIYLYRIYLSFICNIPIEQKILNIIKGAHTEIVKEILSVVPNAVEKFFK